MHKIIASSLALVLALLPLHADDNWLQNGDFSDGTTHWHGDLRSPADFASDNPLQASDPFTSKGMIIPLKHTSWSKAEQDFKGKVASGVLSVTYMLSPDLVFSTTPDDYVGIPNKLDWAAWRPFDTKPGSWMIFVSDFGSSHGTYYEITPKTGSSAPQVFKAKVSGLTPLEDKTITLAIPPGTGTLVILNVSLTGN
jgi:hypothetical protein